MAASKEPDSLDSKFYTPADIFFPAFSHIGLITAAHEIDKARGFA